MAIYGCPSGYFGAIYGCTSCYNILTQWRPIIAYKIVTKKFGQVFWVSFMIIINYKYKHKRDNVIYMERFKYKLIIRIKIEMIVSYDSAWINCLKYWWAWFEGFGLTSDLTFELSLICLRKTEAPLETPMLGIRKTNCWLRHHRVVLECSFTPLSFIHMITTKIKITGGNMFIWEWKTRLTFTVDSILMQK